MKYYNVTIDGAPPAKVVEGTALFDLLDNRINDGGVIVAAYLNNEISELTRTITSDCDIRFLSALTSEGRRVYERSLIVMLVKAVKDLFPDRKVLVRHSVRYDIYFEMPGERETLPEEIAAIEKNMRGLVLSEIPFKRVDITEDEAEKLFKDKERQDLYNAMHERNRPYVIFYDFDGTLDCSYGFLVPHSGYLKEFSLVYRYPGAIMAIPRGSAEKRQAERHAMYEDVPKLLNVFAEYKNWGRILGIENIGDLNRAVRTGGAPDIVRVAEALQEKKISQIADQISIDTNGKKIVLIAGPSSSGKTTFANRLSIQLRVNGYLTKIISMDDYFLNREDVPVGDDGDVNLECPEALDIELFSIQMKALLAGKTVKIPVYDFHRGRRDERVQLLNVGDHEILIVEGIHGLNPKVTASIPKEYKHRIYISALTTLNIDDHNRISTTDARLIRRIVRDHAFRGAKAIETIKMWPSVRSGEEEYIFPYQESCDSMFNSGLIYELGAMKANAQALLSEISGDAPEYSEAVRLHRFLSYFEQIITDDIPPNSILREFIGGSCFRV